MLYYKVQLRSYHSSYGVKRKVEESVLDLRRPSQAEQT